MDGVRDMSLPDQQAARLGPQCIASTGNTFCTSVAACHPTREYSKEFGKRNLGRESNCFRSAQLSIDGSTIVTYSEDLVYRSFILPPDLLDPGNQPHTLQPYSSTSPHPSTAFTLYPYHNLSDTSSTLALLSHTDFPTRLTNTLALTHTSATYPWIHATTEAFITPSALAFSRNGLSFIAAADSRLASFDLEHSSQGPALEWPTRKSHQARRRYGETTVSLGGLITTLAIDQNAGVLAAGSAGRGIALYDNEGSGEAITSFSLADGDVEDGEDLGIGGNGLSKLMWSRDGRYLFAAERLSHALHVYDIRVTGKRLAWLKGRKAFTTHRLGFDVLETSGEGVSVWAGGVDGAVRVWKDVTSREGPIEADTEIKVGTDSVSSVLLHPTAAIFATTSGQREPPEDMLQLSDTDSDSDGASDSPSDSPSDSDSDVSSDSASDDASDNDTESNDEDQRSGTNNSEHEPANQSTASSSTSSTTRRPDNTLRVWTTMDKTLYPEIEISSEWMMDGF